MIVGAIGGHTELAVIGAGPGGYTAALRAADAGLDVTLIDSGQLGGACLNVGCIPSKALIELAHIRHAALAESALGIAASRPVDMARIRRRIVETTETLRAGVASLLADAGVDVVTGTAHFARYDRLSIATHDTVSHLEFDNAIVATGSRPVELDALPFGGSIIDSTGALELERLPETVAIVGAGYIGVELGTAFAKLGAGVTVVEAADRVLPAMPAALARSADRGLRGAGARVLTGTRPTGLGSGALGLDSGEQVPAEVVVVAIGRRPNSDTCSLSEAGATVEPSGLVSVGPDMSVARGIYAIGDLVAGPALAHKATAEAEVAVENILGRVAHFDPAAVPAVVFCDPELMTVGVDPEEAAAAGLRVHRFPHVASGRAHTTGSTAGFTIVVSDGAGTVVGVHCAGPHASELAGEAALAIEMSATLEELSSTIHPHPTMSETLAEAAWLARGAPLHIRR